MKHLTIACVLFAFTCHAQQGIMLPKDNGKTTSFCESLELRGSAQAFYDTACARISRSKSIRTSIINGDELVAHMHFTEMQQGVYGKVTIRRSGGYVNYCFQDFRINSIPYDEWVGTANATVAEQVKGRIFSTVVLLIADFKNESPLSLK